MRLLDGAMTPRSDQLIISANFTSFLAGIYIYIRSSDNTCRPIDVHTMLRAKNPCRQLNSEGIKSAALCYVSPVVSGRCSIVSAKCVCNVRYNSLRRSWASICKTRDSCDTAISSTFTSMHGMLFQLLTEC